MRNVFFFIILTSDNLLSLSLSCLMIFLPFLPVSCCLSTCFALDDDCLSFSPSACNSGVKHLPPSLTSYQQLTPRVTFFNNNHLLPPGDSRWIFFFSRKCLAVFLHAFQMKFCFLESGVRRHKTSLSGLLKYERKRQVRQSSPDLSSLYDATKLTPCDPVRYF